MKSIIVTILFTVIFITSCGNRSKKYDGPLDSTKFVTIAYFVDGLEDVESATNVELEIQDLSGIYSVEMLSEEGKIIVVYDKGQTNPKQIVEVIEQGGRWVEDTEIMEDRTKRSAEPVIHKSSIDTITADTANETI